MPANDNYTLRDQLTALMAAAPLPDYSDDSVVTSRLGKLFADQADAREDLRRFGGRVVPLI